MPYTPPCQPRLATDGLKKAWTSPLQPPRPKHESTSSAQSGYHRSQSVKDAALAHRIQLHYLPPYSPNLNPIERLWKLMNEQIRNNVVFQSAQDFRERLALFFTQTILKIKWLSRH